MLNLSSPKVTRELATAIPVYPGGAYRLPAVGSRTMSERTAARLPSHGSSAIGLGRYFFFRFRTVDAAATAAVVTSSAAAEVEVISEDERMADEVEDEGGNWE